LRRAPAARWVADNETNVSTLYNGAGVPQSLSVQAPGGPTGMVFYNETGLMVTDGTVSGTALFMFAAEDGTISGCSPAMPPITQSRIAVPNASAPAHGAI
jgi:hypothetical protein